MRLLLIFGSLILASALTGGMQTILEPVSVRPHEPVQQAAVEDEDPDPAKKIILSADDLRPALIAALTGHYNLQGSLRLAFLREWRGVRVPADDWSIEILDAPAEGLRQHAVVRFAVRGGDDVAGTFSLPLRCEIWAQVFLTTRRMAREEPLAGETLSTQAVDVLRLPDAPVPANTFLGDHEIARAVGADVPLLWRDIVERPLVRKNALVEAVATEGPLSISMLARALESGRLGDTISIRNLDSKRDFQAQVIHENKVRVFF